VVDVTEGDATDRWVQRLRDGIAPQLWPIHLVASVLVLGAPVLIVAEFRSTAFVADQAHVRDARRTWHRCRRRGAPRDFGKYCRSKLGIIASRTASAL